MPHGGLAIVALVAPKKLNCSHVCDVKVNYGPKVSTCVRLRIVGARVPLARLLYFTLCVGYYVKYVGVILWSIQLLEKRNNF